MKKIRLLLIDNPITSLFMSAYLKQIRDTDYENIAVYTAIDQTEEYSENCALKNKIYKEACIKALEGMVNNWINCQPTYFAGVRKYFSPKAYRIDELLKERKERASELSLLNETLLKFSVSLESVSEIWFGNATFAPHLFYLCKNATGVHFEHGLSDVRNAVIRGHEFEANIGRIAFLPPYLKVLIRKVKHFLFDKLIISNFIFFSNNILKYNKHVSILGDEIKKANQQHKVISIDRDIISSLADTVIKQEPGYLELSKIKGNSVVILLSYIKSWAKNKNDHLNFFNSFERYIAEKWSPIFRDHNIKNILFKSKFFHEEHSEEGFNRFDRLNKNFNLYFLSAYSKSNYPTEYYLPIIKPIILLGSYSSGLFYSKKMLPELLTFSYDEWFIEYCMTNFQQTFPDYKWLKAFFNEKHYYAFKNLCPLEKGEF